VPIPAQRVGLDAVIVLDASASMDDDVLGTACAGGCGSSSKWAQTVAGINTEVSQTETTVNWGLVLLSSPGNACDVGSFAVPVASGNALEIAFALANRTSASGGVSQPGHTPTRSGITFATTLLAGVPDDNPRLIVLATDGAPDCPAAGDISVDDSSAAVDASTYAMTAGVPVHVVGIGVEDAGTSAVLDRIAAAGGTGGAARYVLSASDVTIDLHSLVEGGTRCLYTIPPPPPNPSATRDHIGVLIDGNEILQDWTNGWGYTNAARTQVQLFGGACAAVTDGSAHVVSIVYHCLLI
jgi:hypothetical protein